MTKIERQCPMIWLSLRDWYLIQMRIILLRWISQYSRDWNSNELL
ncbi:unnamed protein product [Paramecium pentaurelia]|uniref:Uncharacterized protein n=1 Tax=Paramecium pentaurelia TaxID=43138 RepID=A0A8S1XMW1_9CILI|nr:unnamed protein product [Paramecium pentaurelia]